MPQAKELAFQAKWYGSHRYYGVASDLPMKGVTAACHYIEVKID